MSFVVRGAKNAFRNTTRTLSIVVILALSVGLALTMLIARQAVQERITSVKSSIGNGITVSPAGARGFQGGGDPLTADQVAKIKATAHVTKVTATLSDQLSSDNTNLQSAIDAGSIGRRRQSSEDGSGNVMMGGGAPGAAAGTNGTFTLPVMVTGTTDPTNLQDSGGGTFKITSGSAIDGSSSDNVAMVGQDLATKNNLTAGSTFQAYGTTVTVKGIYTTGNKFGDTQLIMPLATVQRLSSQTGDVTSAAVQVDSIDNVAAVTSSLKSQLGDAADVVSQQDTSNQALEPLENITNITLYSLIGAVAAGAVIIFLTMLMIVRERRREIGVFKAIGTSNVKIVTQFISEATVLTLLGAVVGIAAGAVFAGSVVKVLVSSSTSTTTTGAGGFGKAAGAVMNSGGPRGGGGFARSFVNRGSDAISNIHAAVGWDILLYGLAGAIIIALIGSAIPAYLIAKVRPAEVMRGE